MRPAYPFYARIQAIAYYLIQSLGRIPASAEFSGRPTRRAGKLTGRQSDLIGFRRAGARAFAENAHSPARVLEFRKASRIDSEKGAKFG